MIGNPYTPKAMIDFSLIKPKPKAAPKPVELANEGDPPLKSSPDRTRG